MSTFRSVFPAIKKSLHDLRNFSRDLLAVDITTSRGGGGILIVRIDAIGDYLLFRQCLQGLRHAPIFVGKTITLCGNAVWQTLAERLDGNAFDFFIPVERMKFYCDNAYRRQVMMTLRNKNFDYALQPTFSRERMGDSLVWASRATKRVGFACPTQNISLLQRTLYNYCYTELIQPVAAFPFELQRNEEVLKYLTVPSTQIPPFQSIFSDSLIDSSVAMPVKRLMGLPVLFIGANSPHRCWPNEHFAEIVFFIFTKLGKKVVLGGGPAFNSAMDEISRRCPGMAISLPETSLLDIAALIAKAPLVVSNDSSGAHMGATFNTPTVIISNGQHRGRFTPYPKTAAPLTCTVYPEAVENSDHNYYYESSPHDIADVHPDAVKKAILSVYNQG